MKAKGVCRRDQSRNPRLNRPCVLCLTIPFHLVVR
jgi:hypothetical protein